MVPIEEIMTKDVVTANRDETLFQALGKMNKTHAKELPVVDEHNKVLGLISYYDILDIRSPPANLKVDTIMIQVPTLSKDASVEQALDLAINTGVEAMVVVDKYGKVIGIVSEYDLLKHYLKQGLFNNKDIIDFTRKISPLSSEDSLLKAKRKMGFYHVPLLPVINKENKFVGIIDSYDLFFNCFTQINEKPHTGDLTGEMIKFMSESINEANTILKLIEPININAKLDAAIQKMLDMRIKAIPVTNLDNEVAGILLRKDALTAISDVLKAKGVMINFSGIEMDEITSEGLNEIAEANVRRLSLIMHNIESIEVHVKPIHYVERKRYEIKMRLEHSGNDISVKEDGADLFYTFERAFKKLITVVRKEFGGESKERDRDYKREKDAYKKAKGHKI